ncbi:YesL family protein [Neobacillus vireti]|uniref:YesL family protein n=1 Tax=Neobacillus vireti TaxID=220686 RepID=UPI0030002270
MFRMNLSHFQYAAIFNYGYWFLMLNLYFAIANIPFILALSTLQFIPSNMIYYFITLIPMGPALAALMASLNKIVVEKDISVTKDFWKFFKGGFPASILLWTITLALLFILTIDIAVFMDKSLFAIVSPLFIILSLLLLNMVICGLVIMTKTNHKLKSLFILSFYYSIKKFYITILNTVLACFFIFILLIKPVFAFMVLPSLIFFLIVRNSSLVFQNSNQL